MRRIYFNLLVALSANLFLMSMCGCGQDGRRIKLSTQGQLVETQISTFVQAVTNPVCQGDDEAFGRFRRDLLAVSDMKECMELIKRAEDSVIGLRLDWPRYDVECRVKVRMKLLHDILAEVKWEKSGDANAIIGMWERLQDRWECEALRCERLLKEFKNVGNARDNKHEVMTEIKAKNNRNRGVDFYREADLRSLSVTYRRMLSTSTIVLYDKVIKSLYTNASKEEFLRAVKRIKKALGRDPKKDFDHLGRLFPEHRYKLGISEHE